MRKIVIMSILLVLLLFGCSKGGANLSQSYGRAELINDNLTYAKEALTGTTSNMSFRTASDLHDRFRIEEEAGGSEAANLTDAERKLIKRANVTIRTENLEAADASIAFMLQKYEAYAASTNIEENSRYYSLRVPAKYYDVFLADMNGVGRLLQRFENTEDVTLRYYDLEGRLATKKELLKTFQAYLGKANNIEEILAVEARIAELQYDIEGTGIQLRNLGNQIDYSTIDLSLLGPISANPGQRLTIGERIKQLFGGFGDFLASTAIAIIGIIVYGIPVLILLVLLYWLLFGRIGLLKKLWILVKSKK